MLEDGSSQTAAEAPEKAVDIAQLLVDSVVDYAIYMLGLDGTVKSWNAGAQRIKGYTAQEIIGSNFSVFYTDDDIRAGEPQHALEVARATGSFRTKGWRVRKGGTRLWASVVIDAVRNPAGELVGFAKVTQDVTQSSALPSVTEESGAIAQMLVDNVVDYAIYLLDLDGIVKSWNAGAQRINGYSAKEIIGKNFSTFYKREDIARGEPSRSLEIARTTGKFEAKGWRVRKDGTLLLADVVIDAVRDVDGQLVGYAKITRDITYSDGLREVGEQLRAENYLMAMAERMAKLGHWRIDLPLETVQWSAEVYATYGLPSSFKPTLQSVLQACHPDDRAHVNALLRNAIHNGTPFTCESRIVRPNGTVRHVLCHGQPERGPDRTIIAVIGVFQDITERKDAERERERLVARLRVATQAAQVGVWDWDISTNEMFWNPIMFALYGLEDGKIIPTFENWTALLHSEDRARVRERITLVSVGKGTFDTDFRVVWPGGEIHHIRAMGTVVGGSDGPIERVIGTNWDITAIRMLSDQLQKEKDAAAFLAAHDVLTGLLNRRGFEEWIDSDAGVVGTILYLDVDGFKAVNDRGGHAAGDETLQLLAGIIRSAIRAGDCCARIGGDEFVLVLLNVNDPDVLGKIIERIISQVEELCPLGAHDETRISMSIGVGRLVGSGSTHDAMREADADLYRRKKERRARVV